MAHLPFARNRELHSDMTPSLSAKTPVLSGAAGLVQNLVADPVLRDGHQTDHTGIPTTHGHGVKPLPLTTTAAVPLARQTKGYGPRGTDHGLRSFSSDDIALNKQIVATHAGDFSDLDMRPILGIIEDILRLGRPLNLHDPSPAVPPTAGTKSLPHLDTVDEKKLSLTSHRTDDRIYHTPDQEAEIVRELAFPINKISCEIICKASAGGEAHSVAMELLRTLANYSWDAKAVITFAAFSINYGEFWLVEHHHMSDPLAKNTAILKDLPLIMEHAGELKKKFDQVLDLLLIVLKVVHCIIQLKELPTQYIKLESPEITAANAHVPTAVYWIIRSLLACTSILLNLIGSGHEYITSTSESWEISTLAHKLSVIMEYLQKQYNLCRDAIEETKQQEAKTKFVELMKTSHIDNMKVLRAFIRSRDDQKPLYNGSKRITERLDVLRLKYVLLLITDLNVPQEELNVLHLIYEQQVNRHEYEVLWLPIVGNETKSMTAAETDPKFYGLRDGMPWYSVDHYSLIEPVAIWYMQTHWEFVHMPMLVVLDPQGRASNLDALPMMWIWGSRAFNFTTIREEALWAEAVWNIELLAEPIDARIPEWMRDNRVICLYGGEDMEWIRKFTSAARTVSTALHVPLEMLYVGKRNPKDKVRRCHEIINNEKLSHTFPLQGWYDYTWYFWVRLSSMWNSKNHMGTTIDHDKVMKEIMDILTFDSSEQGWAVFSRGNYEMTKAKGDVLLLVLDNYQNWAYKVDQPEKFVTILDEEIHKTHPDDHCNRLILPGHAGYIPERVVCSECGKTMDKFVMYRCCTD